MESEFIRQLDETVLEMKTLQERLVCQTGRLIIPNLTTDDLLQPNDYPELEHSAYFRYEEGVLAGIMSMEAAINALKRDVLSSPKIVK